MCVCVCVCVCLDVFRVFIYRIYVLFKHLWVLYKNYEFVCALYIYIYIYIYLVEHNRHFLSTYFLVDPFILPYWFYNIRRKLVDVSSIIVYFPSTSCLTLGYHQERIYYRSDVTFVCTLLLYNKKSIRAVAVCSVYLFHI